MKKLVFGISTILAFTISSCCRCTNDDDAAEEGHGHDSTAVIEESHEEEESVIAFNGVDKGDYTLYGHSDITADGAISVADMMKEMKSVGSFNNKVSIQIAEVCQQAGCWITFNDDKDNSIRVFFRDHFTIPIETAVGTDAILYGALVVDTLSVDFQKHLLDDAKATGKEIPQSEYDAIKKDKIEKTFDCESILVKKAAH